MSGSREQLMVEEALTESPEALNLMPRCWGQLGEEDTTTAVLQGSHLPRLN